MCEDLIFCPVGWIVQRQVLPKLLFHTIREGVVQAFHIIPNMGFPGDVALRFSPESERDSLHLVGVLVLVLRVMSLEARGHLETMSQVSAYGPARVSVVRL